MHLKEDIRRFITARLNEKTGRSSHPLQFSSIGGGSINETYRVHRFTGSSYFLKINSQENFPGLFEKEKNGLALLARQKIIRIPSVIFCETTGPSQLLLLEWIEPGLKSGAFWQLFGEKLAQLHRVSSTDFGGEEDNYMGALVQLNKKTSNWVDFFIHQRLTPQVNLAMKNRQIGQDTIRLFEDLYKKMGQFFPDEIPSLLHGDLWSGNYVCDEHSSPVLIDPAVYFGSRHMDLAMTALFGGFDRAFYEAYHYHYPLPAGHAQCWDICNLYPLLIHLNLFGSAYLNDINRTLKKFT